MTKLSSTITIKRPLEAHPTWLPVDGPPWRLVDASGTTLRDSDGYSLRFSTDKEALLWMERHGVALLAPRW